MRGRLGVGHLRAERQLGVRALDEGARHRRRDVAEHHDRVPVLIDRFRPAPARLRLRVQDPVLAEKGVHDVGEVTIDRSLGVGKVRIDGLDRGRTAENPPFRSRVRRLAARQEREQCDREQRRKDPLQRHQVTTSGALLAFAEGHSRPTCSSCCRSWDGTNDGMPTRSNDTTRGAVIPARHRSRPPENQSLGAIPHPERGLSVRGGPGAVKVKSGTLRRRYSIVSRPIWGRWIDTAGRAD